MPLVASSTITSSTSLIISGSSAEVGSSNSRSFGSIAKARAIATRCCCPPESSPGIASALSASADSIEELARALLGFGALATAHLDRPERHVAERGLVREEVEALEHHADVGAETCELLALGGNRLPVDRDRARIDGLEPVDHATQRRLPRSRRPDHDHHLTPTNGEIDVVQAREATRSACAPLEHHQLVAHVSLMSGLARRRNGARSQPPGAVGETVLNPKARFSSFESIAELPRRQ